MAGSGTVTTRKQGVPDSGFPSELQSDLRIRVVDEEILDISQVNELQIIKLFGGFDGAQEKPGIKYEWMMDDQWKLRDTVADDPLTSGATTLTLSGSNAHRYPRGTILQLGAWGDTNDPELVWVSAQLAATTLTIVRDYAGTTATARALGDTVLVAGFSEVEGTTWTLRTTAVKSLVYNYMTMMKGAVRGSWANEAVMKYGIAAGQDLNEQMARSMKQVLQSFNNQCLLGQRDEGQGVNEPATTGGVDFFVTSANGAYVSDLTGAALTLKDIMDMFEDRFYEVGAENVGKTLLTDYWAMRKINSFYDPGVRLETTENAVGLRVNILRTPIGDVEVLFDAVVPKGKMYLLRTDQLKVVRLPDPPGQFPPSRLHVGMSANTATGDFTEMYLYGVYGLQVKNPATMGIIHSYSLTT